MKRLAAVLVLLLIFASVQAVETTPVATVNGEVITSQELDEYARITYILFSIKQTEQDFYNALLSTEEGVAFLKKYQRMKLDELIDRVLLKQWANRAGITINEEELRQKVEAEVASVLQESNITEEQFEQYALLQGYESSSAFKNYLFRDELHTQYLIAVFSKVTESATVTEDEIKQYYEAHKEEFYQPSMVHVLVIRTNTDSDAKKALDEISNGMDFEEVAKRYSTLENVDGGWRKKDEFESSVPAEALFLAQKGAVFGPYRVSSGWEIYKLIERKEESHLSLDEARDQIVSTLMDAKREELWNRWYEEEFVPFKEQSRIEIGI
ncbi:MAG: hypothetical protein PWP37_1457 [Thermotogota bacterium]|nr:hypothetical protein [Thermotogota bacterium]MDK2865265.1 hypothetical protein [Thermotogota bacterium]HCZ06778.1 hypothetical protein [Thermotogota bacterium]